MNHQHHTRWLSALALAAAAALGGAHQALAKHVARCPDGVRTPYTMQLKSLTGPAGADLTVTVAVDPASGCALPGRLARLLVTTDDADGSQAAPHMFRWVPAPNGVANVALGTVPAHRRVEARVALRNPETRRMFVVEGATKTLLRPDLVVTSVSAPDRVLVGRPFAVAVTIAERNEDVGATATVALPAAGQTRPVTVPAGGTATVEFPAVTLSQRGLAVDLAAEVREASPAETDTTNNAGRTTLDALLPPDVVVQSVSAPERALVGRPFAVSVVVAETNKDVGATVDVTLPAAGQTLPATVAAGGSATVEFPAVTLSQRGRPFELTAQVGNASPAETDTTNNTLAAALDVLLPPDLVVRSIDPQAALVGKPFTVSVLVAERNGDLGATGTVTLSAIPGASMPVQVEAGGTARVDFPGVSFDAAVSTDVHAAVVDATPAETDTTNNELAGTIDVSAHMVAPAAVLFPSFGGYGAQFNHHLYAPITKAFVSDGQIADVEQKIKLLEPQLVRIFYSDNWEENIDGTHPYPEYQQNYDSFVKVVELAQEAGATIDISYQNLGNLTGTKPKRTPQVAMAAFANALEDLVRNHHLTNVRWAECANEPNGGAVTLELYNSICRALKAELVARGLSDQIHLMGGGLVEGTKPNDHYTWMQWIATNMNDVFDAYAQHIYWWYDKPGRFEYRLRDIAHLMTTPELIPAADQKPSYLMEYGIRGYTTCPGKPQVPQNLYYRDASCTEIWRTNIAAFQQFWFSVDAAQLGYAGASKWDAYWAVYDRNSQNQQVHWMVGPASEGYPLMPSYYAMSLLFHTVTPGWQIVRVEPWADGDWQVPGTPPIWDTTGGDTSSDQPGQELTAFAGPNGELTVLGLDSRGRDLNTVSTEPPEQYSVGGLPPNTSFTLALWNATGDGTNSIKGTVTTSLAGVARFEVPLQAAFALTTVPVH